MNNRKHVNILYVKYLATHNHKLFNCCCPEFVFWIIRYLGYYFVHSGGSTRCCTLRADSLCVSVPRCSLNVNVENSAVHTLYVGQSGRNPPACGGKRKTRCVVQLIAVSRTLHILYRCLESLSVLPLAGNFFTVLDLVLELTMGDGVEPTLYLMF